VEIGWRPEIEYSRSGELLTIIPTMISATAAVGMVWCPATDAKFKIPWVTSCDLCAASQDSFPCPHTVDLNIMQRAPKIYVSPNDDFLVVCYRADVRGVARWRCIAYPRSEPPGAMRHRLAWMRASIALAGLRANRRHPLRDCLLRPDVLGVILAMAAPRVGPAPCRLCDAVVVEQGTISQRLPDTRYGAAVIATPRQSL
jgi:hypothetical protein